MLIVPKPLNAYIAASNRQDFDAMLAPFAPDAIVQDEGRIYTGHAQIMGWMVAVTEKYRTTAEVTGIEPWGKGARLAVLVSGNFLGSPATLHYTADITDDLITRLAFG